MKRENVPFSEDNTQEYGIRSLDHHELGELESSTSHHDARYLRSGRPFQEKHLCSLPILPPGAYSLLQMGTC